jgi:hypothetical protein
MAERLMANPRRKYSHFWCEPSESWTNILGMPYQRLVLTKPFTPPERKFFLHVDALLADVYTMASKHPLKRTKAGGCNFPAALVLTCILDALAKHIHPATSTIKTKVGKRSPQQVRIEEFIIRELPWEPTWTKPSKRYFARALYLEFRNPLVHEVGRDPAPAALKHRPKGFSEPAVAMWGPIKGQRIGNIDARRKWRADWPIFEPDPNQVNPITQKSTRFRMTCVALYWAVKQLAQRMAV